MKNLFFNAALICMLCLGSCGNSTDAANSDSNSVSTDLQSSSSSTSELGVFNPTAGKVLADEDAKRMVKAFTDKHPGMIKGYYFGRESYEAILSIPNCAGIRIYHGLDDAGNQVMMLVPTDKNGQTLFGTTIYEFGQPCPPYCDTL